MPLILLTGIPSSGKSTVVDNLQIYFSSKNVDVKVISEEEIMLDKGWTRNTLFEDSRLEKELRSTLKANYLRNISSNSVLIIDGLNYIKGFRYEIYCGSKSSKSTQCVIHCDPGVETAWQWNENRENESRYSRHIFDLLVQRYEMPESRNRWDSPLITLVNTKQLPYEDIHSLLFDRKPPPPNQSTQCPPMSDTNFLHEIDKAVQIIVSNIITSVKMGLEGEIAVEGSKEKVNISANKTINMPNLLRLKRQFLVYVKSHPDLQLPTIPTLFVQYLNTNL